MTAKRLRVATITLLSSLIGLSLNACVGANPTPRAASPTVEESTSVRPATLVALSQLATVTSVLSFDTNFDGKLALDHVLEQTSFGPRPTGSEASLQTADYIQSQLESFNWAVSRQPFVYENTQAVNLVGKAGTGTDIVILGAHFDTRRRADQDRGSPQSSGLGANDGASGVAVLLELARVLDLAKTNKQVWLVFFDAEDNGQLDGWDWIAGSRFFVENLEEKPSYAIIVDMVGDKDQNIYLDSNSDKPLRESLWALADTLSYGDNFIPQVRYSMLDDHTPFMQAGIPAVDIIDFDYPYWHTLQDTPDKVSAESLERVGTLLEAFLENGGSYPVTP